MHPRLSMFILNNACIHAFKSKHRQNKRTHHTCSNGGTPAATVAHLLQRWHSGRVAYGRRVERCVEWRVERLVEWRVEWRVERPARRRHQRPKDSRTHYGSSRRHLRRGRPRLLPPALSTTTMPLETVPAGQTPQCTSSFEQPHQHIELMRDLSGLACGPLRCYS